MLPQILAHRVFLKADVLAQFDVRQFFSSSLACVLVNPRLGNFEHSSKLVNGEQCVKIPIRQDSDYSLGEVLRVCAHRFYGNAETGCGSRLPKEVRVFGESENASRNFLCDRNISFHPRRLWSVLSTGEAHTF